MRPWSPGSAGVRRFYTATDRGPQPARCLVNLAGGLDDRWLAGRPCDIVVGSEPARCDRLRFHTVDVDQPRDPGPGCCATEDKHGVAVRPGRVEHVGQTGSRAAETVETQRTLAGGADPSDQQLVSVRGCRYDRDPRAIAADAQLHDGETVEIR